MDSSYFIENIKLLNKERIKDFLMLRGKNQEELILTARDLRNKSKFQNKAELRSVIELSNICSQSCRYCSMGKNGNDIYFLSKDEILNRMKILANLGRRTFLLQSGESHNRHFIDDISFCCEEILKLYPDIKIILCLGNLSKEEYKQLKDSGASRYILKFETANGSHHKYCRPSDSIENRIKCIENLIEIGFQTGSGNIVGLPGQTLDNLYEDLVLINKLDLAMVSATKFISNEYSEFKNYSDGDIDLTLNFLAILRILKPDCLIPSTSSLETNSSNGQLRGLLAGCNTVTIHDGTPKELEKKYTIYSEKRYMPEEEFCINIIKQAGMEPVKYLI